MVAIIQDADGFTNVRAQPGYSSEVIHKILDNEVFWYHIEENQDWVSVFIPTNKYSIDCGAKPTIDGYIHKSRLKPLNELQRQSSHILSISYNIKPFEAQSRIIEIHEDGWVQYIDGRLFWGTDGEMPRNQISDVNISIGDQKIFIPQVLYEDIYECSNDFEIFIKDNLFFIYQMNSDGAGGYELVWVISKEGLVQRLVGTII